VIAAMRRVCGRDRRYTLVDSHPRVDDDEAEAVLHERAQFGARLLGQHKQRAVGRPVHQTLEERDLAVVLMQRRAEHDPHVLLVKRLGHAGDDHREVGRVDQRNGHADEAGTPGRKSARAAVRAVAVLAHDAFDGRPRGPRDVPTAVDDARHGGRRDAGEGRDLADCEAPVAIPRRCCSLPCRAHFQKRYMFWRLGGVRLLKVLP
jgi:hypothetical protein